jgi:hypothetical protein
MAIFLFERQLNLRGKVIAVSVRIYLTVFFHRLFKRFIRWHTSIASVVTLKVVAVTTACRFIWPIVLILHVI